LLTDRKNASRWEKWSLGTTELKKDGGVLSTISEREKKNYPLIEDMAALLNHAGSWCINRAAEFESH
jgi:hypothetical protein